MESWLRGSKEGSYCKPKYKYKVVDVQSMVVTGTDGTKINWTEGQVRGEEEEKKKKRRRKREEREMKERRKRRNNLPTSCLRRTYIQ